MQKITGVPANDFARACKGAANVHTKRARTVLILALSRKEATRTPDPYVPNVVRYQLRYFPIAVQR